MEEKMFSADFTIGRATGTHWRWDQFSMVFALGVVGDILAKTGPKTNHWLGFVDDVECRRSSYLDFLEPLPTPTVVLFQPPTVRYCENGRFDTFGITLGKAPLHHDTNYLFRYGTTIIRNCFGRVKTFLVHIQCQRTTQEKQTK
jgi:hypothetical protein